MGLHCLFPTHAGAEQDFAPGVPGGTVHRGKDGPSGSMGTLVDSSGKILVDGHGRCRFRDHGGRSSALIHIEFSVEEFKKKTR
jgi:hypothetical protein